MVLGIVADGIGGHQAGEIASQLTVDMIVQNIASTSGKSPLRHLQQAIKKAGMTVSQAAGESPEREGMGSTVVVAMVIGSSLFITSVGDSRIYLLREGVLLQLTIDHTWVQEAIEYDIISLDEAKDHPHSHVLRRHIGADPVPEADLRLRLSAGETDQQSDANQGLHLQPGDKILLCTDGLTDMLGDPEILQTISQNDPEAAVTSLIDKARTQGGDDNITVVLLGVPDEAPRPRSRRRSRWLIAVLVGSISLICLILAGLTASWWFGLWPWSSTGPGSESSVIAPGSTSTELTSPVPGAPTLFMTPTLFPPTISPTPADTATPFPLPTVSSTTTQ